MRRGGSKSKGAGYERDVCKRLSLWVTNGKRQDIFWRSAMSGGRATINPLAVKAQSGDISLIDPIGSIIIRLFVIECKRYKTFFFDRLLNGRSTGFLELWLKLVGEAKRCGKMPMLICKANHGKEMIVVDGIGVKVFADASKKGASLVLLAAMMQLGIYFYDIEDVLTLVDPFKLRTYRRRLKP